MANIAWLSNSPQAQTGYGMQTAQVVERMKKAGHDVAIFSNYGTEGHKERWQTKYGAVDVYPRGIDGYSNDIVPQHYRAFMKGKTGPGLLIALYDAWVFRKEVFDAPDRSAIWAPIDHKPMPEAVAHVLRNEKVTPIAMSRYGEAMMHEGGLDPIYVPHAIGKVFKPTPEIDGIDGREWSGFTKDQFVVGMNAANKGTLPNRKSFPENLLAFSIFAKDKDDVILYLHTDVTGAGMGINLLDLLGHLNIDKNKVMITDPYDVRAGNIPQDKMAGIYSTMNVLLATSMGEGFGVPTIEAQACGVPVIVSNFAASAELVGHGWKVEGQPFWDPAQKAWFTMPSVPGIVDALEQAYAEKRGTSKKAIDFAKKYEADNVFKTYWKPALERLTS